MVREQPRQSLGHRLNEARVLLTGEVLSREEPEGGAERGVLSLVSELAMARLPVDQSARGLGEPEEHSTELIPANAELLFLDLGERGALGLVIRVEAARLVPIPTPRRTLDPVDVEHSEIVGETIEFRATRTTGLLRVHPRHANPFADGAM